jgi:hypothetical protein
VTHVLLVPALQFGDPMRLLILMESHDLAFQNIFSTREVYPPPARGIVALGELTCTGGPAYAF